MKRFWFLCFLVPGALFANEGLSSSDFKGKLPLGTKSREHFEMILIKGIRPPPPKKDPKKFKFVPMPKMKTLWVSRFRTVEGTCKFTYSF